MEKEREALSRGQWNDVSQTPIDKDILSTSKGFFSTLSPKKLNSRDKE
jgi:hypothetical protein